MYNKNRPNTPSHAIILTLKIILLLIFFSTSLHLPLVNAIEDPLASTPKPNPNHNPNNGRSNSSLMVMLIILFFGFCVIFTIAICILKCSDNSSPLEAHEAFTGSLHTTKANHHGLQQFEIDSLPRFLYSEEKQLKIGEISLECAVCLTEFEEVETLRLLSKCNHVFHAECIDFWLVDHKTCPVCRANLILDTPESSQKCQAEDGESRTSCEHHVQITIEEPEKRVKLSLPRSHSTGHLMVRPCSDDIERFTLRLPNEVRLRLLVAQPKRTKNKGVSSSLRGYRSEGSGSSHYDRILGRARKQYNWSLPL